MATSTTPAPPQVPPRPTQQVYSAFTQNEWNNINESVKTQGFWKYHVLRVSPFKFYLTTNPDNRHRYARPGPGYYVHLQFPNDSPTQSIKNGFRLVFRQQDFGAGDIDNTFTIEKLSEKSGGHLTINFRENEYLDPVSCLIKNNDSPSSQALTATFERQSSPSPLAKSSVLMFSNYKTESLNSCQLCPIEKSMFSTTGSKIDGVKLAKAKSVYFIDTSISGLRGWHDPVISLFRHCERSIKSKITKKMVTKTRGSSFQLFSSSSNNSSIIDDGSSDFSTDFNNEDDEGDDDIADESMYYIPKDGLYDRHPQDDSPNDYKFGWITIYDKSNYFSLSSKSTKSPASHNWEVVLGITLASAIEAHLDSLLKDSSD